MQNGSAVVWKCTVGAREGRLVPLCPVPLFCCSLSLTENTAGPWPVGFRLLSLLSEFAGCGFRLSLGALTPSIVLAQWTVTGCLAVCLLVPGDVFACMVSPLPSYFQPADGVILEACLS